MEVLVDTGILLRAFDRAYSEQKTILRAFRKLWTNNHQLHTTSQNIAEFWNVCTRPVSARGGYGISVSVTEARVQVIEQLGTILPFTSQAYLAWRSLLVAHQILGVSVHDARIVAVMQSTGIQHLLTLNGADFQRYTNIKVLTPNDVLTL